MLGYDNPTLRLPGYDKARKTSNNLGEFRISIESDPFGSAFGSDPFGSDPFGSAFGSAFGSDPFGSAFGSERSMPK